MLHDYHCINLAEQLRFHDQERHMLSDLMLCTRMVVRGGQRPLHDKSRTLLPLVAVSWRNARADIHLPHPTIRTITRIIAFDMMLFPPDNLVGSIRFISSSCKRWNFPPMFLMAQDHNVDNATACELLLISR